MMLLAVKSFRLLKKTGYSPSLLINFKRIPFNKRKVYCLNVEVNDRLYPFIMTGYGIFIRCDFEEFLKSIGIPADPTKRKMSLENYFSCLLLEENTNLNEAAQAVRCYLMNENINPLKFVSELREHRTVLNKNAHTRPNIRLTVEEKEELENKFYCDNVTRIKTSSTLTDILINLEEQRLLYTQKEAEKKKSQ